VTKDLKVVDLETNAGMLEQTSAGYEGLRAEELMPDLGPRASRGSAIGTLNLVGAAPIAALEGHWRRISSSFGRRCQDKRQSWEPAELCLTSPFCLDRQTLT
jgi:hypothetical protein